VIVPRLLLLLSHTVIPIASAGDPVVVNVVDERVPVNAIAGAVDQCVVVVSQVPVPPTQYFNAIILAYIYSYIYSFSIAKKKGLLRVLFN
jgi:hypothetical protein